MEHTKGKWIYHKSDVAPHFGDYLINVSGHISCIVRVYAGDMGTDAKGNAHHICQCVNGREKLQALSKQLLDACKVSKNALNVCVRFLLGTGEQPTPEEMGEAVLIINAAIEAAEKEQ